jgi:hypothetical protein
MSDPRTARRAWREKLVALLPADADEVVSIREPEGPVSFHWILARR